MPKIQPFEKYTINYEKWFIDNKFAFLSELKAIEINIEKPVRKAIEIGVGTGQFASKLGIKLGIEPSK